MKRRMLVALAALAAWWGAGSEIANAQLGAYPRQNPISPYQNLGLPGSPGINYYGLVRPEIDANRAIGNLQQGLAQLNVDGSITVMNPSQAAALTTLQTGHPTMINNYQRFFPLSYGQTTGNIAAAGAGTAGMQTGMQPGAYGAAGMTTPQIPVFFGSTFGNFGAGGKR
jgi:hypothetical protein